MNNIHIFIGALSCVLVLGCRKESMNSASACPERRERVSVSGIKDIFDDLDVPTVVPTNIYVDVVVESNKKEKEFLQRIVLPGIANFDGRTVDPIYLFAWLEKEAIAHDPAKEKVRFSISISSNDVPLFGIDEVQRQFAYRKENERNQITLPDAVMVYGSLFGFVVKFQTNCVVVHSTIEEVARWHKLQGSLLFDHVKLPEDCTSTNEEPKVKKE